MSSMDASVWEAISELRSRLKVVEQRLGIRDASTMAVATAEGSQTRSGYTFVGSGEVNRAQRFVVCPACLGLGLKDDEPCRTCDGRGFVEESIGEPPEENA
jgi:DnaJ-class molecular chaperone